MHSNARFGACFSTTLVARLHVKACMNLCAGLGLVVPWLDPCHVRRVSLEWYAYLVDVVRVRAEHE